MIEISDEKLIEAKIDFDKYPSIYSAKSDFEKILWILYVYDNEKLAEMLSRNCILLILMKKFKIKISIPSFDISLKRNKKFVDIQKIRGINYYSILHEGILKIKGIKKDISSENFLKDALITTDKFISLESFVGLQSYLSQLVLQINRCYNYQCFDAVFVLLRRLIESLIILTYEKFNLGSKIKDNNSDYFHLNNLIKLVVAEPAIPLGSKIKQNLNKIKDLGDASAHNIKYIAKKEHVDKFYVDIILIVEEFTQILKNN